MRAAFCFGRADAFRAGFDPDHFARPGARAGESEAALAGKAIEHPPPRRVLRDESVVRQLIEVKTGLLRMQQIDLQFQPGDLDLDFVGRLAR